MNQRVSIDYSVSQYNPSIGRSQPPGAEVRLSVPKACREFISRPRFSSDLLVEGHGAAGVESGLPAPGASPLRFFNQCRPKACREFISRPRFSSDLLVEGYGAAGTVSVGAAQRSSMVGGGYVLALDK